MYLGYSLVRQIFQHYNFEIGTIDNRPFEGSMIGGKIGGKYDIIIKFIIT